MSSNQKIILTVFIAYLLFNVIVILFCVKTITIITTDSYKVGYSVDALDDLREIYSYIANELLVPETASAQLSRIRKEVRSLDFMPARYALVDWEPCIYTAGINLLLR